MRRVALAAIGCVAVSGCTSPEATRTRGGGPGADTHNRPAVVKLHEGSQQYWETPVQIEVRHPSLDSSRHAEQVEIR